MVRDELSENFYSFGVFCDEDVNPLGIGILTFKSTGIKCYKSWMSSIRGHTILGSDGRKKIPPMYSHINRFTTTYREEGKKAWYVPTYSPAIEGDLNKSMLKKDHPAFMMARQAYESVQADAVKIDYNKMRDTEEEASGSQAGGHSAF